MRYLAFVLALVAFFACAKQTPLAADGPKTPVAPAAYTVNRGSSADPGLATYCSAAAPNLPARARLTVKTNEASHTAAFDARAKLLQQTPDAILAQAADRKTREDMGDLLYTVGQRYIKDGREELAVRYWDCAAQKYVDTKSMLKLAKIAFHGTGMFKTPVAGEGAADYARAYFWVSSAIYLDLCDGQRDNIIANGLGPLDELQNVQKYVTEHHLDRAAVEKDATAFITAIDPKCESVSKSSK